MHTEMMVDSMVDLYEAGVITNRKKTLFKDKFVCTFAFGSRRLYEWLDDNLAVEFQRGKWVNAPAVIRNNSRMVSLNTCLMVDLTGQIASESIGTNQYSGTGGQSDTAVGAQEAYDDMGKSVIACHATKKKLEPWTSSPERLREISDRIPLKRIAEPEEIAGVVSFLTGPDAGYLTGITIFTDGGRLTW
ncbi:MAG: SDR family oxidoreductase [Spirochaetaceae bacterium]